MELKMENTNGETINYATSVDKDKMKSVMKEFKIYRD